MKSGGVSLKLAIAFGLLIAIFIGVGSRGLYQMSVMNNQTQQITDVCWLKVKLATEALHYSDLNNRITMQVFLMDDQQQIAAMLKERAQNTETISGIVKQIQALVSSNDERMFLSRVADTRKPYVDSYLKALDLLISQQKPQEARELMLGTTLPNIVAYHDAWDAFVAYQGRQMDLGGDAVEARFWATRERAIAIISLAVIFMGAVATFVIRAVTREISRRRRAEQELMAANTGLEVRVRERTAELERAQGQLLESSRLAGMAEIATGVLHNVGNVLNSVNVSANVIVEKINQSPVGNLCKATDMIEGHQEDLATFLTVDEKGRQLPKYFSMVSRILADDNAAVIGELSTLAHGIEHIKQIVQLQQDYASSSTVRSRVDPASLVEDALRINLLSLARHHVTLVRQIANVGEAEIDKHKTLQILINLISNAKNAVKDLASNITPTVTLRLSEIDRAGAKCLKYEVIDNGVGIPPENLSRMFSHGFTTRTGGHGFGLHSAANATREMGGTLTAFSDGPGKGARFTLEIPLALSEATAL